ncbi:hypothetical protein Pcinc_031950 [Petrolisthes cinctipes]|uniref:Uncharacterized protein n=1 Tax=Petrolisthes cinctipes TaxID=88211 RepID=A0AAE1K3U7_PETCI|nr:hypothetical protein Pcinc_031950 [Petrolisthes cinctipes]
MEQTVTAAVHEAVTAASEAVGQAGNEEEVDSSLTWVDVVAKGRRKKMKQKQKKLLIIKSNDDENATAKKDEVGRALDDVQILDSRFTKAAGKMNVKKAKNILVIGLCNSCSTDEATAIPSSNAADVKYNIMDPLLEFEELEVLEDVERERLPRRIVKDRLDLFLSLTEDEFTSRFRVSKQTATSLLAKLHLPEAHDSRGI